MLEFWKGHALGNDYVVIDAGGEPPAPDTIRALCDRHRGVGADGVLVGDRSADPVGLRIFNPDGSEAEKSGNGLRIFGAWLDARGAVDGPFQVALPAETVTLEVVGAGAAGERTLRVDMGRPSFQAGRVGYTGADPEEEVLGHALELEDQEVEIHLVDLGNPHCVVFTDDLDPARFRRLAPVLQAHPAFERGVNVQLARPVSRVAIEIRIWERGAGETLASGSSACAVAAAAVRSGRLDGPEVEVRAPGGTLIVEIDDHAHLTGPAQIVFRGEIGEDVLGGWR